MATQIQLRRGSTAQHATFTGAVSEVTVDTDKDTIVVHDGSTVGGVPLATEASVDDRIQVANAAATFSTLTQLGNTNSYIAGVQSNLDTTNANVDQKLGATASVTLSGDVTGTAAFSANAVSITTDIAASGTPTGTFGSASKVPVITVGADGRITNISNTNVAGVTGFTYTAANNTFAITTADGGLFTSSIDELDNYALTSTVNATFETKSVALSANNAQNTLILDRIQVANATSLFVNVSGDTMSGALAMGTNKITGMGNPTAAQDAATKTYVDTAVANIVDTAPEALNTLNELAAALGDDANFATTTATSLGSKAANTYVNSTFQTIAVERAALANTNAFIATKQDIITGGATTIASSDLTVSRALVSDGSGKVAVSAVTSTELGYLDGVTSAIQTQLDGKGVGDITGVTAGSFLTGGGASGDVTLNVDATNAATGSKVVARDASGDFAANIITAVDFNATSDQTMKTNINTITSSLDKLDAIRGVNFNWKKDDRYAMGVIAQEVEEVIPEVVRVDGEGLRSVNYGALVGLLIEAVKDLKNEVEELKRK